jgi:predicted branched-subunit amino acid permease
VLNLAKSSNTRSISISVGLATGLYGISFGALSSAAGLDIWQTMALSLLMFSGGSQFAFVGVIASGGVSAIPGAIASSWLLGVRNGFYAVRMAPIVNAKGAMKLIAAEVTIDESTAVALSRDGETEMRRGFWWTGASVYVFWNTLTLVGALLGEQLGDPGRWGLDAAAAAAFVGLVWPRLVDLASRSLAAVSIFVAVAVSPFVPAGVPVLLSGLVGVIFGFAVREKAAT